MRRCWVCRRSRQSRPSCPTRSRAMSLWRAASGRKANPISNPPWPPGMCVRPDERPFATADLIRLTTFAATERVLKERIAALARAGYDEIALLIVPGQEHAIEDWGKIRRVFA